MVDGVAMIGGMFQTWMVVRAGVVEEGVEEEGGRRLEITEVGVVRAVQTWRRTALWTVRLERVREGEGEEEEGEVVEEGGEVEEEDGAEEWLLLLRWRLSTTLLVWTPILHLMLGLRLSLMVIGGLI